MNPPGQLADSHPDHEPRRPAPSRLFTLRLWRAELGESQTEWRGQLQHVVSGQIRYFRGWPTLIIQLGELLSEPEAPAAADNGTEPGSQLRGV